LAASRPWEGLTLAAPVLLFLAWRLGFSRGLQRLMRLLGPALALTALSVCALGYYNWRVTGSATTMPYQAYMQQYDVVPVLRFQQFRPEPVYGNEQMREYHLGFQVGIANQQLNGLGFSLQDLRGLAAFLLGRPLSAAALLGLLCWPHRRLALVVALLVIAGASHAATLINPYWPHYFAPYVPLLMLLALRGLRVMHAWKFQGRRPAAYFGKAIVVATVCALVFSAVLSARKPNQQWDSFVTTRNAIVDRLSAQTGDDLILVRYWPGHFVHSEWVFNLSSIDSQPVVWARELGPDQDADLLDYFRGRHVWLLEADANPPRISPYPAGETPSAR
jgi:hypothetical protein